MKYLLLDLFSAEIMLLHSGVWRSRAIAVLDYFPEYFFTAPAAKKKGHHPEGETLVEHTKVAMHMAEELMELEQYSECFNLHDEILFALLIHDCCKYGTGKEIGHYAVDHPLLACGVLDKENRSLTMDECELLVVKALVSSHMGQWNKEFDSEKEVLPKPRSECEKFVHLCDYLSSRPTITYKL